MSLKNQFEVSVTFLPEKRDPREDMTAVTLCEEHSCRKCVSFSLGISEGRLRSHGELWESLFLFPF